ncbi:hypothetical protein [Butyrivibrio sp. AE3004]|uniref:hypothetical protein n=1 Tax=Butyrivibrio sp. AE3004 TaxID=1506994 RepID=UPI000A6157C5|nr:hypothetical protein [Butyrivibrio sp. AE3004]
MPVVFIVGAAEPETEQEETTDEKALSEESDDPATLAEIGSLYFNQGDDMAIYNIGHLYYDGKGVKADYRKKEKVLS